MSLLLSATATRAEPVSREGAKALQEGNRLLSAEKFGEALAAYDKAAESMPGSAEVSYNRGIALYRLGRFDKAQTAFQDSLRPERPDLEAKAKYNLGLSAHAAAMAHKEDLQGAVKDLDRAIAFYKDSLELRKDDADCRHNLAAAEKTHAFFKRKLELLKQQSQSQPSSQPGDKSDEESDEKSGDQNQQGQKSDESSSQPTDSKDDQQDKQESNQNQQASSQPSDSRDNRQDQGDQGQDQQQPEEQDGSDQNQNDNQNDNISQNGMQNQNENNNENDNQSQQSAEEQKSAESQPAEQQATSQPSPPAASQPTSMPSGDPRIDLQQLTREQALQMLQAARDAERRRREIQRQRMLQRQGRIPVDKDW